MESTEIESEKAPSDPQKGNGTTVLLFLFRLILGGIFIYSGGAKLLDLAAFQNEIANFELISWKLSAAVALYLPWLEIVCGVALVTRKQLRGALVLLSSLMILFIVVVSSAWVRGLDVSCGCFGFSESETSYPRLILRNLAILTGLLASLFIDAKRQRSAAKSSSL